MLDASFHKKTKGELLNMLEAAFDANKQADKVVQENADKIRLLQDEVNFKAKLIADGQTLLDTQSRKAEDLNSVIFTMGEEIEALKKKLDSTESSRKYAQEQLAKKSEELESVHDLLDAFPNPPARKSSHEESYNRVEYTATTRIAVWLASFINPTINLKEGK